MHCHGGTSDDFFLIFDLGDFFLIFDLAKNFEPFSFSNFREKGVFQNTPHIFPIIFCRSE